MGFHSKNVKRNARSALPIQRSQWKKPKPSKTSPKSNRKDSGISLLQSRFQTSKSRIKKNLTCLKYGESAEHPGIGELINAILLERSQFNSDQLALYASVSQAFSCPKALLPVKLMDLDSSRLFSAFFPTAQAS